MVIRLPPCMRSRTYLLSSTPPPPPPPRPTRGGLGHPHVSIPHPTLYINRRFYRYTYTVVTFFGLSDNSSDGVSLPVASCSACRLTCSWCSWWLFQASLKHLLLYRAVYTKHVQNKIRSSDRPDRYHFMHVGLPSGPDIYIYIYVPGIYIPDLRRIHTHIYM